jgi:hypothetical protein
MFLLIIILVISYINIIKTLIAYLLLRTFILSNINNLIRVL